MKLFKNSLTVFLLLLFKSAGCDVFSLEHVLEKKIGNDNDHFRRLDFGPKDVEVEELKSGHSFKQEIHLDLKSISEGSSSPLIPTIDLSNIIAFAKLSFNAYLDPSKKEWIRLNKTKLKESFGWDGDSLRGHVFANADKTIFIIALKGTSGQFLPGDKKTSSKDKKNDNLLFSCCCARVDFTWYTVCDCYKKSNVCSTSCLEKSVQDNSLYFYTAQLILFEVQKMYPNALVWLTGHSLGGSLCALLGLAYNIPCLAYEAPGETLASRRMHLPSAPAIKNKDLNIWHIGHNADPLFMGDCTGTLSICYIGGYAMESKCHNGKVITFDTMKSLNWSSSIYNHQIGKVLDQVLLKANKLPELITQDKCIDCSNWVYED